MNTVVSQEGADLLWSEGVGAGGHAGEQRVLQGVLNAKLLKVCSCLGDLHSVDACLEAELLYHFFHGDQI